MNQNKKDKEKKKSGFAFWFTRAKEALGLLPRGAAGAGSVSSGVVGAGSASANAAAAAAAATQANAAMVALAGLLGVGGFGAYQHHKHVAQRAAQRAGQRAIFADKDADAAAAAAAAAGKLPGDAKPYSSLGMVSVGDVSSPNKGADAGGAGKDGAAGAGGGAQDAGAAGAMGGAYDAAQQAMAQAAHIGNAGSGRAARLPGQIKGPDFEKLNSQEKTGASFTNGAPKAGAAGRADNSSGHLTAFNAGAGKASRSSALIGRQANRSVGHSTRDLTSAGNDASRARQLMRAGSGHETFAVAAGTTFDGNNANSQVITGLGAGQGGNGIPIGGGGSGGSGGGGGGGGGGNNVQPGPNGCPAGFTFKGGTCEPQDDQPTDECSAEVSKQRSPEGWWNGMLHGHVGAGHEAGIKLAAASGCKNLGGNRYSIYGDGGGDPGGSNTTPDQDLIDYANEIMLGVVILMVSQFILLKLIQSGAFDWWPPALAAASALYTYMAYALVAAGALLMAIGLDLLYDSISNDAGLFMPGLMWSGIGLMVAEYAWQGRMDGSNAAQQQAQQTLEMGSSGPPGGGADPGSTYGTAGGPPGMSVPTSPSGPPGMTVNPPDPQPVDPYGP